MFGINNAMQTKMYKVISKVYKISNKKKSGILSKKEFKYIAV